MIINGVSVTAGFSIARYYFVKYYMPHNNTTQVPNVKKSSRWAI